MDFRRSGEVIIEMHYGELISLHFERVKTKELGITRYGFTFVDSYVESIVLLDKRPNHAVTYQEKRERNNNRQDAFYFHAYKFGLFYFFPSYTLDKLALIMTYIYIYICNITI